jgi:hypothetical protein
MAMIIPDLNLSLVRQPDRRSRSLLDVSVEAAALSRSTITRAQQPPAGSVMLVTFELAGQEFHALKRRTTVYQLSSQGQSETQPAHAQAASWSVI